MELLIGWLFLGAILGLIPAEIGKHKGYSWTGFWLFGVFFFLIALIVVLILPKREKKTA
jgi:hypothetical protein